MIESAAARHLLAQVPLKRAAYSDRTALLMAVLSELAYLPFELADADRLGETLAQVRAAGDDEAARARLAELVAAVQAGDASAPRRELEDGLREVGCELVRTYSVSDPRGRVDTQAFLARLPFDRTQKGSGGMLILCFRGTEKKPSDWKTDLKTNLAMRDHIRLHEGFYDAFASVRPRVEADLAEGVARGDTVYLTGHSLGGALAVVATRLIANDSTGACYTFGQPMVGEYAFQDGIKTPIYRVVNGHDIVPRVPPGLLFRFGLFLCSILRFPLRRALVRWLSARKGYAHIGDMRYLVPQKPDAQDQRQQLLANPSQIDRVLWWLRDVFVAGDLLRPVRDHSMAT